MDRLVRDDVIGAWAYTPPARDTLASLPARGWVETWRALTIMVRPAAVIAAHYAAFAPTASARATWVGHGRRS